MNDNLSQQIDAHNIRLDKIQRQLDSLQKGCTVMLWVGVIVIIYAWWT